MSKRKWTDNQFIEAVNSSLSYSEVMRKLNLRPAGGNYDTIKKKIAELNLDVSHMTGQGWNTGERYHALRQKRDLKEVLVQDSTWISTNNLRKRLLTEGIKERKCELCGNSE